LTTTLLVAAADLAAAEVTVEGDAYRHLFRARRLAAGDRLRLADGAGAARWAEVAAVDRRSARLVPREPAPAPEPAVRVHLLVAAPKKERASWLVEKATELGVAALRLIETERTPREFGDGTLRRLERVAAAAFEQCGRGRMPELTGTHAWEEVPALLAAAASEAARWVLDLEAEAAPARRLVTGAADGAAALLVGPEGGWSNAERRDLAAWGCRPAVLGPTVLRVETAAVAGAALLLAGPGPE
jgi:16S rRNA (uracil1498-N3)-methyltransferase